MWWLMLTMGRTEHWMDPEFIAAVARVANGEKLNVSRWCREHDIGRETFRQYVIRVKADGADGFKPRSSRPHHSPTALPAATVEAVLRARKELDDEGRDNGPISICWRLEDTEGAPQPSRSSVYRILVAHGQITPEPKKRPHTTPRRFEYADPNALWQIDGTNYQLADGTTVCIIQVIDDHSRYDPGTFAARSENGAEVIAGLDRIITAHGRPVKVLTDNSKAFSGKHRGYLAALERHLAGLHIAVIASSVYHPQTCGKNERAHRTLQKWLDKQPRARDLVELQTLLDRYRDIYNHRRHQGLDGHTPQQRYDARPKVAPTGPTPASGTSLRAVSSTGVVAFSRTSIVIGRQHANTEATVFWQGDRVAIMIGHTLVRQLTLDRSVRYQRLNKPNCPVSHETDLPVRS